MKEKDIVHSAKEIFAFNQTKKIMSSKAKDLGKYFYHYTVVDSVKKILLPDEKNNRFIFVRNIAEMNDLNELELHNTNGNKIHIFCTCCTKHEKIPLWYLYSGICGNGARLGFTPGKMITFLNSIKMVYPVTDFKVDYDMPLEINRDFELQCGWVFYLMDGNNRVFYKNDYYDVEEINKKTAKNNFFIKDYPWEYEREFRIVIINKTSKEYEKIALPIPDTITSSLEVMFAPEYNFSKKDVEDLVKCGIHPDKIKNSKLHIKMNLLQNNRKHIVGQMEKWCNDDYCQDICAFVKSKKRCNFREGKK